MGKTQAQKLEPLNSRVRFAETPSERLDRISDTTNQLYANMTVHTSELQLIAMERGDIDAYNALTKELDSFATDQIKSQMLLDRQYQLEMLEL